MAAITGNDGTLTDSNYSGLLLRTWAANAEYVTSEVTSFAAVRSRAFRRGLPMIRGTLNGTPNRDVAQSAPGVGATGGATGTDSGAGGSQLILIASPAGGGGVTVCSWTFTAIRSNINLSSDKVGDAGVTHEFMSGDPAAEDLVESWDES